MLSIGLVLLKVQLIMKEQSDICSVSSCDNLIAVQKHKLCNAHYLRLSRHGSVQEDKPLRRGASSVSTCEAVGCSNPTRGASGSWCSKHYYGATSFYKRNPRNVPYSPKQYTYLDTCVLEGCESLVYRLKSGMCYLHTRRNEMEGSPGQAARKKVHKYEESAVCLVPSCENKVSSLGYCSGHYSRVHKSGSVREDVPLNTAQSVKIYIPDKNGKGYFRYFRFRDLEAPVEVERFDFSDLIARDGTKCQFCLKELDFSPVRKNTTDRRDFATLEHLLPISRGGAHTLENVILLCWSCNSRKNNKTVAEYYEYEKLKNRLPVASLKAIEAYVYRASMHNGTTKYEAV